ncbi:uncharacterized protein LACBIDRAFT_314730 [Laccaria bicolor S238N-H82]|uniref:Predicted protein n=1 Tax=Laccaria bicolor (strain S238N-H82 / ATCC MYA-4686) TaxID=486041 RepID=B0DZ44_LACBS|nr:uncharacterized protein LACBIDRAFT_314730 [Laccaria bicolor S238N-H82]EDR00170.1 predicted protein [Laccaria bicolor S238N-H82]|eukprot:XP_001889227.1 predicted protein [Laccaria bicolor S238N-H82]
MSGNNGSDDTPSSFTPDPNATSATDLDQAVVRHLTFWRNGFQVEDGELMWYDDPENTAILEAINAGYVRHPPLEPRLLGFSVDEIVAVLHRPSSTFSTGKSSRYASQNA